MDYWKNDRIGSAIKGENLTVMVKMKSGFAVIADNQFLPGYCVLLSYPKANSLNELTLQERSQYLIDMTLIGDAIIKVCNPLRINYSILMNLDCYLHAHIQARYDWEPGQYKQGPMCLYPKEQRFDKQFEYSEQKYGELKRKITEALNGLMEQSNY